jgi:hypothetical protein
VVTAILGMSSMRMGLKHSDINAFSICTMISEVRLASAARAAWRSVLSFWRSSPLPHLRPTCAAPPPTIECPSPWPWSTWPLGIWFGGPAPPHGEQYHAHGSGERLDREPKLAYEGVTCSSLLAHLVTRAWTSVTRI